jgi:hypothetical protein
MAYPLMKSSLLVPAIALNLSISAFAQEVAAPALADPAADHPAAPIRQLSPTQFQVGDIRFDKATRRIEFPGHINMQEDLVEYALVHKDGKTHESLLATGISPFQLNLVMLLCGYEPGNGGLFGHPDSADTPGDETNRDSAKSLVKITLTWTLEGDAPVSVAPEDLILNRFTGKPMTRGPWLYNGSTIEDGQFQAELEGSIIAIYLDQWSMFNSPRPGSDDDQRWTPITEKTPPRDTPVTIVIEPASPDEPEKNS